MIYLKKIPANPRGRDFVCGDLHGQREQLYAAMVGVGFDITVDRVFSVGDLIDRGADSKGTFELVQQPWFFAIRGNHEALMFDAYVKGTAKEQNLWLANGGSQWVKDPALFFNNDLGFRSLLEEQIENMPWAIELSLMDGRKIGLVHAQCPCDDWLQLDSVLSRQDVAGGEFRYNALWSRVVMESDFSGPVVNIDLTVHGHCIFKQPVRRFNSCFIDTGAFVQRQYLLGLSKKLEGFLSLIKVEDLFQIPQYDQAMIRELSGISVRG